MSASWKPRDRMNAQRKQCKAKSKQSGERCKRWAMQGMDVCATHGGKSLKGIAAPAYKTGKHSKYMPQGLLARYDEVRSDPELLNLTDHVALLQARQTELLERLEPYDSEAAWARVASAWEQMQRVLDSKDAEAKRAAAWAMTNAIEQGADDWEAWAGVIRITESIRKLSEAERKRRVAMQALVTVDDAALMYGALTEAIHSHVDDAAVLAAIAEDFARIVGGTGRTAAAAD